MLSVQGLLLLFLSCVVLVSTLARFCVWVYEEVTAQYSASLVHDIECMVTIPQPVQHSRSASV